VHVLSKERHCGVSNDLAIVVKVQVQDVRSTSESNKKGSSVDFKGLRVALPVVQSASKENLERGITSRIGRIIDINANNSTRVASVSSGSNDKVSSENIESSACYVGGSKSSLRRCQVSHRFVPLVRCVDSVNTGGSGVNNDDLLSVMGVENPRLELTSVLSVSSKVREENEILSEVSHRNESAIMVASVVGMNKHSEHSESNK